MGRTGVTWWAALALVGAVGCNNKSAPPAAANGSVVDAIVVPMLHKDGVTVKVASDGELCRRLALDLTGVVPSWDEYTAHCQGKSPADMVDWFMAQPGYVTLNQRLWADAFSYDDRTVWYQYIADLDALVAKLYRGQVSYSDFAVQSVTHPAFVGEFVGENVVAYAFQAFLGRDALPEERQDLLGLYRVWTSRPGYDPAIGVFKYNPCTTDVECGTGRTCQPIGTGGAKVCAETTNYRELIVDPRRCAGPLGQLSCTSTMHGITVQLSGTAPIALASLTPDQEDALRAPGRVITALPYFWESAVDNALHRYLGWWHGAIEIPKYEIPAVRQALATLLQQRNDLRALDRAILTSVLYTMPADQSGASAGSGSTAPGGDAVPSWHFGPTKQMIAESFLDSVGKVTGVALGNCDWRFPFPSSRWLPANLLPPKAGLPNFDYLTTARTLGGCPDPRTQPRYTDVGVLYAMEQRALLAAACVDKSATHIPPAGGETASALVTRLYRAAFTVDPATAEVAGISATLPGADATTAQNLCQALLRSGRFLFY